VVFAQDYALTQNPFFPPAPPPRSYIGKQRFKFPSSWQVFRALQSLVMKPKVSSFLLESRKRKSGNARGSEKLHLKTGRCVFPTLAQRGVVATQLIVSRKFVSKLSSSLPRKMAAYAKHSLCNIPASFLPTSPQPPRGACAHGCWARFFLSCRNRRAVALRFRQSSPAVRRGRAAGVNCHAITASHAYFGGQYLNQPCLTLNS